MIILMWANDQLFSFSLSVLFVRRNIEQFPIIFIIPEDKFLARHLNIKRVLIYLNQLPLKYQSFALDCLSRNSGKIQNRREKKWGFRDLTTKRAKGLKKKNRAECKLTLSASLLQICRFAKLGQNDFQRVNKLFSLVYVKKFSLEQVCEAMCKKLKINHGRFF